MNDTDRQEHPLVGKLLRIPSGLRRGGNSPGHEVLATYWTEHGDRPFAFCLDGLLIDPEGEPRLVPYDEIEDTSYYDVPLLKDAKRALADGEEPTESLPITLCSGELIDLPLNKRPNRTSERLLIAGLVEQRVRLARSERRKRADSEP